MPCPLFYGNENTRKADHRGRSKTDNTPDHFIVIITRQLADIKMQMNKKPIRIFELR